MNITTSFYRQGCEDEYLEASILLSLALQNARRFHQSVEILKKVDQKLEHRISAIHLKSTQIRRQEMIFKPQKKKWQKSDDELWNELKKKGES